MALNTIVNAVTKHKKEEMRVKREQELVSISDLYLKS